MAEIGFVPLSSQLGVAGTSYRIQLGEINDRWAVRLLKGKEVIDSYVFKDEDVQGDFPNQNIIVGWVLRTVAIPNINPHQIMKTTQALVKQAMKNKEEQEIGQIFDELSRRREHGDEGNLPFPYIFRPPTPPGDLGLAGEPQSKEPEIKQVPVYETYCKYCGAKLPKGQTICHVCGKKV